MAALKEGMKVIKRETQKWIRMGMEERKKTIRMQKRREKVEGQAETIQEMKQQRETPVEWEALWQTGGRMWA